MTTVEEDRTQTRVNGLLQVLRDAEADFRRSYSRVLGVVAELEAEKAGAVTGFGTTARLLAGSVTFTVLRCCSGTSWIRCSRVVSCALTSGRRCGQILWS